MRETEAIYPTEKYEEKSNPDARDIGHVSAMAVALSENMSRMEKALEALALGIEPTLKPTHLEEDSDQAVPNPVRCSLADELSRTNNQLYRLVGYVQRLSDRVDI